MKNFLSFFAAALMTVSLSAADKNAFSDKFTEESVMEVCKAVSDWQIDNFDKVKHNKAGWHNGALYIGMFHWSEMGQDAKAADFLMGVGKSLKWGLLSRSYHADDICVGQMYLEMYKKHKQNKMIQPLKERAFYVATHPSDAPLSKNDKIGKDTRWSWCDALFMAPPVYAGLYTLTGEQVYKDYLMSEYKACTDSLYDHAESLYYRDCKRIGLQEPNGAKQFWGRGNGWVFGGIPLILNNLPDDDPDREYFVEIYKEMAEAVLKTQDKDGHWHASLLDPGSYPAPENSCSAFFCYGIAWGINNGILDGAKYKKALKKGWRGLVESVNPDGKLGYVQPVGAAPKKVSMDSTEVYGVGAFLMAGVEIMKMIEK
jgi:rhamnogalacturonyl hydrolase YesR